MAQGARILRVSLELALVERGVYETLPLTVAEHPSEARERSLVRVLARGLFHAPDLAFGRGVSTTDEPDLWERLPDGRIEHWIEVGQPAGKRLVQAARKANRVSVLAFGKGVVPWRTRELDAAGAPPGLRVLRLDDAFVDALGTLEDRQLRLSLTLAGGTIYLDTGAAEPLSTTPEPWLGEALA